MLGLIEKNRGVLRHEIRNVSRRQIAKYLECQANKSLKFLSRLVTWTNIFKGDINMETKWEILSDWSQWLLMNW